MESAREPVDWNRVERLFPPAPGDAAPPPVRLPGNIPVFVPDGLRSAMGEAAAVPPGTSPAQDPTSITFDQAGYYASLDFADFIMSVEGTDVVHGAAGQVEAAPPMEADYYEPFVADYSGGVVRFGFAGADYLVHFECRAGPGDEDEGDAGPGCITPAEADALVARFLLCRTDGRCVSHNPQDVP